MPGLATVLPLSFTDTTLPILDLTDKLLTAGSILLVDPAHSTSPWPAGVPASAAGLPNIAWQRAKAVIGSGDAGTLGVFFDDAHQAADALFERTAKGGLHGIYSQVNNGNINRGAALRAQPALRSYIYTNRAHRFYLSVWNRRTRLANIAGGAQPRVAHISSTVSGGNRMICFDTSETFGNGKTGSREGIPRNTLGVQMRGADGAGFTVDPTSDADTAVILQSWGNYAPGGTAWENKAPSDIFYRAYIEDLTVSGRTFAQVDAIDFALWQAAFAAGGRYFGDTFTDPATFP